MHSEYPMKEGIISSVQMSANRNSSAPKNPIEPATQFMISLDNSRGEGPGVNSNSILQSELFMLKIGWYDIGITLLDDNFVFPSSLLMNIFCSPSSIVVTCS